jgi:hypothetical protein
MGRVAPPKQLVRPSLVTRRCECLVCGAHSAASLGLATLGGRCTNCGSYEIAPIKPPHARGS